MNTRLVLAGVFLIAVAVVGYAFLTLPAGTSTVPVATEPAQTTASTTTAGDGSTPAPMQTPSGYTMADVAQHNSPSSCWSAINGKVYDLTNWINQHPGGPERIIAICGIDGSSAFNAQHGGQRQPAQELAQFYLGPLSP